MNETLKYLKEKMPKLYETVRIRYLTNENNIKNLIDEVPFEIAKELLGRLLFICDYETFLNMMREIRLHMIGQEIKDKFTNKKDAIMRLTSTIVFYLCYFE